VRNKYWLYVVTDCTTEPRMFRVQDPVRLAFKTRQSFTLNISGVPWMETAALGEMLPYLTRVAQATRLSRPATRRTERQRAPSVSSGNVRPK
jgi:hypothetical protein